VALLQGFLQYPFKQVARGFFLACVGLLLAAFALIALTVKAHGLRLLLMGAVFLGWQPFRETLAGPQMAPLFLFLYSVVLRILPHARSFWVGAPVGLSAALKAYPAGLLVYFALRRRWGAILGTIACGAAMLALSAWVLSPRYVIEYLTQVLPRSGGTSLVPDNVGLMGAAGRLSVLATAGANLRHNLFSHMWYTLETHSPWYTVVIAWAIYAAVAALVVTVSIRTVRRAPSRQTPRQRRLAFGLAVTLLIPLLPTSWPDYQALLALPLMVLLAFAPPPSRDPLGWVLLALAMLPGLAIDFNADYAARFGTPCSMLRGAIPLWLWLAGLRFLRRADAETAFAPPLAMAPQMG
jgi:Glycosyltransferase family 87